MGITKKFILISFLSIFTFSNAIGIEDTRKIGNFRYVLKKDAMTDERTEVVTTKAVDNRDMSLTLLCGSRGDSNLLLEYRSRGRESSGVQVMHRFDSEEPSDYENWQTISGESFSLKSGSEAKRFIDKAIESEQLAIRIRSNHKLDDRNSVYEYRHQDGSFVLTGLEEAVDVISCF